MIEELLGQADAGDRRALARLLSIVENDETNARAILRATYPRAGRARVVGVTGPPGAGKSTLVSALVEAYRQDGLRVAVVAVDPTSPFSGGAILGDRIRLRERFLDEGVFIRSMATRGSSGGLARSTGRVVTVLDAVGHDVVLVETVGVGQEEVDVVRLVDTVCLVSVPGLGDEIQTLKAGILEIADVLVVNKADRPGAEEAARDLAAMLTLGPDRTAWRPLIVRTVASRQEGIGELREALAKHDAWSRESGDRALRRREAVRVEIEGLLREALLRRLAARTGAALDLLVARVAARELDPDAAVEELLAE